ncbi:MAG: PAS domain S-box protein, partial [candidate division Zixibacteria bacterium]|nr:PAS domain S-box protein [candidate division Zixibacteria bacterium]
NRFNSAQWERIFNSTANGMIIIDTQYRTKHVNDRFCEMIGMSRDEAIGQKCRECFPSKSCGTDNCPLKRIINGKDLIEFEVEKESPDGSRLTYIVSATALRDDAGVLIGIIECFTNITRHMEAEEHMWQYKCIVSSSNDMLALLDKNFVYLAVNEKYAEAFGKTNRELVGRTVPDVFGDTIFETVIRPNAEKCLQGIEVRYQDWFDFPILGKRFMEITYDPYLGSDNSTRGFVVNGRDITERKQAEEMQERQKEELDIIFNSVPALIFYKDKENRFIRVNQGLVDTAGLPREQIEGKTAFETFPENAERYWQDDLEVINSGVPKRNIVEPLVAGDDTYWVQTDKIPYRDSAGNIIGIIGFSLDITARKRAEEQLHKTNEVLAAERSMLESKNVALKEVLGQIETQKQETEQLLQSNVNRIVQPLLQIITDRLSGDDEHLAGLLRRALGDLLEPTIGKLEESHTNLSPREFEICNMVRQGWTSKQIAGVFCTSEGTVEQQRKKIRRKLGIAGTKTNLVSHLQAVKSK